MREPASLHVPHTDAMLLVDTIIDHHEDSGIVETTFTADSMFADGDGVLQPLIFIELLAQGFASLNGYSKYLAGKKVRKGYLVGVKDIQFYDAPPVTVGMQLTATLKVETRIGDFALVYGKLEHGSNVLVDGTLKLFIPEPS